jgi:hypothetical protein
MLGQTIVQGPFPLLNLWFCGHMRPLCIGSLPAAESSPALRGGAESESLNLSLLQGPQGSKERSEVWGG